MDLWYKSQLLGLCSFRLCIQSLQTFLILA
jgi:hypothetical protein